jgi:lysophospholipase L1-like esterase
MKLTIGFLWVAAWSLAAAPHFTPGLVTTTPVTQNRDHAIYDWLSRHNQVLQRNAVTKPDVVIIGDSIIHYWGGNPRAPKAWGADSWASCFSGFEVTNMGFGWDRTENVLWRIDHGELDGIHPAVVVIKIGTNNTSVKNTPAEIAAGIEAVALRAHRKLPRARILVLGILTRKDEPPQRPSVTDKVNQILATECAGVSWLTFRDFGDQFRSADGSPNPRLFSDGVHVNAEGYQILGTAIRGELLTLTSGGRSQTHPGH